MFDWPCFTKSGVMMLCDGRGLILSIISVFSLVDVLLMPELMLELEATFSSPILEWVTSDFF